jgi:hypothetical protein
MGEWAKNQTGPGQDERRWRSIKERCLGALSGVFGSRDGTLSVVRDAQILDIEEIEIMRHFWVESSGKRCERCVNSVIAP